MQIRPVYWKFTSKVLKFDEILENIFDNYKLENKGDYVRQKILIELFVKKMRMSLIWDLLVFQFAQPVALKCQFCCNLMHLILSMN